MNINVDLHLFIPVWVLLAPVVAAAVVVIPHLINKFVWEPVIFGPLAERQPQITGKPFGILLSKWFWPHLLLAGPLTWARMFSNRQKFLEYRRTHDPDVIYGRRTPRFTEPLDDPDPDDPDDE